MLTRVDPAQLEALERDARPSAIVIGAGFGGLAAGIRLSVKGYKVTLLDRLGSPGGRGTARSQGGYRFDLGPTILTAPHLFADLWTLAGERMEDHVTVKPLDPFYTIHFPDRSTFTASADVEAMRSEVQKLSPGDLRGYDRFMSDSEKRYWFGFENLGRRPMHELWELIKVLPTFAWYRADRSIYAHAARRVQDERLRMALSFHPLFIGGDPFNVTSMYSLVSYLEKTWGVHYVMGGTGALAQGMADLLVRTGGEIRYGEDVDRITTFDGKATGVQLDGGEKLRADLVISNADAGHTYDHLLRDRPKRRWTSRRLKRTKWSMSLFVWYFGTRGTKDMWPEAGHHTILNGPRYRGLVRDIFIKGKLADDMSLYLHRPTVTDPSAAPDGCDAFYALSPVPHLGFEDPVDWAQEQEPYRKKVEAMLESTVLPALSDHIAESHIMTPMDFRDRYKSPHGAGFSIEPRILQSAWFRPHNISEEVENLYLVGAGTHPGAGLPGVISAAEAIDKLIPEADRVSAHAHV